MELLAVKNSVKYFWIWLVVIPVSETLLINSFAVFNDAVSCEHYVVI
jgi:hypothetical protein